MFTGRSVALRVALGVGFLLGVSVVVRAEENPADRKVELKKGDRIIFFGDSLTSLAGEPGPLPPMKIHCAELVQGALRSALEPEGEKKDAASPMLPAEPAPSLLDRFNKPKEGGVKVVFLKDDSASGPAKSK